MVDMRMSNHKLVKRGIDMIVKELKVSEKKAESLLTLHGSVRKAIDACQKN
jgi:N-acetylmuramic acid 6-phosphate etherase